MKNQKLTLSGDDAGIQAVLETIRVADKEAEKTKKTGCGIIGLAVVFGFISTILVADAKNPFPMFILGCSGIALVVGLVLYHRGESGDIEDERYELVTTLHKFITCDVEKDAQYEYHLDLRSYYDSSFFLRKEKFGGMFQLPRGSISYYQMPLLTTRIKLRDGTLLTIQVDRVTARKTVTKRGRSGKVKTKTKNKFRDIYQVRLKVPEGAPHPPLELTQAMTVINPSYKASGPKANASVTRKNAAAGGPDPDLLLRLLCLVFHTIHQGRKAA